MELKQFIRKGILSESDRYQAIYRHRPQTPARYVIGLLEGKCRRKIELLPGRHLYENYYAECFIGLEDVLLQRSHSGAVGAYPGAHFVLWDAADFLNSISIQPELARRAILDLSRRIRIYDARKHQTDLDLRLQDEGKAVIGEPDEHISGALYEMSFATDDSFPEHLVAQLQQNFAQDEVVMRQGEQSTELYIVLEGELGVWQKNAASERRQIDTIQAGGMVGEMA
ncbi:MAG: cyclic nucleotide-binding domain-containing protein, partial [Leptospiraceae bacterium]|nr:cyclic nucleotide-binding domain-containing protein [Leptospiraceae bacterium]